MESIDPGLLVPSEYLDGIFLSENAGTKWNADLEIGDRPSDLFRDTILQCPECKVSKPIKKIAILLLTD